MSRGGKHKLAPARCGNAHLTCSDEQSTRFPDVYLCKLLFCKGSALPAHIEELAPAHAVEPDSTGKYLCAAGLYGRRQIAAQYRAEGFGLERIACKCRCAFAVNHVVRRLAAAQLVVIHARQIVMDKAVGMQHLDRACDRKSFFNVTSGNAAELQHKQRTYALAACKEAVAHGFREPRIQRARAHVKISGKGFIDLKSVFFSCHITVRPQSPVLSGLCPPPS